jgi:putative sterol carrier protein
MTKFLSEEHMETATEALNSDTSFKEAMANVDLGLQFTVTGGPGGDTSYFLEVADGAANLELGELEDFDASVTSDYESASAISQGDLNVQMAFMTGKIKVGGNMAKVMMHQGLINEFARVSSGLDLEY